MQHLSAQGKSLFKKDGWFQNSVVDMLQSWAKFGMEWGWSNTQGLHTANMQGCPSFVNSKENHFLTIFVVGGQIDGLLRICRNRFQPQIGIHLQHLDCYPTIILKKGVKEY